MSHPENVQVTEANNGMKVVITQDASVVIELSETPTSGYRWEIDTIDSDALLPIDQPDQSHFRSDPEVLLGGSNIRQFRFQAVRPEITRVQLALRNRWDPDSTIKRFDVTVQIIDRPDVTGTANQEPC